ncbi:MAG: fatty acid CoA ligase family protein [Planctomycetota bacterium]|jgi:acyl-CoA synthetase (AMP-forming)/AMP-acid ligase II
MGATGGGARATDAVVNVTRRLDHQAEAAPDRVAVRAAVAGRPGRWVEASLAEIAERSRRIASGLLGTGLRPGERVTLLVKPGPDLIALTYGCLRAGIVPVLIDPGMGRKSFLACIQRMQPAALIGIRAAHIARMLFRTPFESCRVRVGVGPGPWLTSRSLARLEADGDPCFEGTPTSPEDTAAILFTSGSTGPPKGVVYTHGIFDAQVEALRDLYGLEPGEVDVACFPLFALFDNALGMTSVIPDLDPSRPATCDPRRIHEAIVSSGATLTFGSPAIWRRVAPWCHAEGRTLEPLRRILIAGAPVPPALIESLRALLPDGGDVHTPYGATECLPVSSVSGAELVDPGQRQRAESGAGNCVGRPAPGVRVRTIPITDAPLSDLDDAGQVEPGSLGELLVTGPTVTPAYAEDHDATALAKLTDTEGRTWHRMGDLARIESDGRIWFQGRKSHRLETTDGVLPCVPTENAFNTHPRVHRSALVGVGPAGEQVPVLVVECEGGLPAASERESLTKELLSTARALTPTAERVVHVLFHPSFPVDVRHNAKIHRLELRDWAAHQL